MLLLPCASEVFPAVPTPLPEILSLTFQRIRHESDPGSTRIPDRLVSDPAGTACVLRVNVADNMMKFFQLARVAGNAGFVQGVVFGDVLLTAAGMVADIHTIRCIVPVYP